MAKISLFDLMGAADSAEAAARWPWSRIRSVGYVFAGDEVDEGLLDFLTGAVSFRLVAPGSGGGRIGLTAEIHIDLGNASATEPRPLVLERLPDFQFWLMDTLGVPGRLYVTQADNADLEIVVEGVPVEIRLPNDLLRPLRDESALQVPPEDRPDVPLTGPFVAEQPDSFAVVLREVEPSSIYVRMRARFTERWEVVLEPAVPLSFGPCVFAHLPCAAIHDLMLLPHVELAAAKGADEELPRHEQEIAVEWARAGLGGADTPPLVAVRTIELAEDRPPLQDLLQRINRDREPDQQAELVVEDIAAGVPLFRSGDAALARHGRVGLRRRVQVGGAEAEAYDHSLAPLRIPLAFGYELRVFRLLLQAPEMPPVIGDVAFADESLTGSDEGVTPAVHVHVGDDGLVQLGYELANFGRQLFRATNLDVRLIAFRVGVDVPRLAESRYADSFQVLLDLALVGDEDPSGNDVPVTLESQGGERIEAVLRNLGWDRGKPSADLWIPETIRGVALDRFALDFEEVAFITEANGGRYLLISGGIPFPGSGLQRAGEGSEPSSTPQPGLGSGIRYHRLRLGGANVPDAPLWGLDGLTVSVRTEALSILGQGVVSDFIRDGHTYREHRFAIDVAVGKRITIGGQFVHGRARGPADNFDYLLAGAHIGGLPSVAGFALEDLRGVFARRLIPALAPPDGNPETMRLYRWYRTVAGGRAGLALPDSRSLSAWQPRDDVTAWGVGARVSGWGKALTADVGVFFVHAPEGVSFVIGADLFALESTKPFAFAAVEHDASQDKWSVLVGVDATLSTLFGDHFPGGDGIRLSGQFFWTNRPSTWALGFIDDTSSWPGIHVDLGFAELFLGGCYHSVDAEGGPNAWAIVLRLRGGFDAGRLGSAVFALDLGYRSGAWRNQATATGALAWLQGSLRIELFGFFGVGLFGRVEMTRLGPAPTYHRYATELRIETPWWMPDVTFRKVWTSGEPLPAALPIITIPVGGAAALALGSAETHELLVPLPEQAALPRSLDAIRALPDANASDLDIAGIEPLSCDSVIAVRFAAAVDDMTTVGENTPTDAGLQENGELQARYQLVALSIRRRAHHGANAGVWTELLAPEDTQITIDDLGDSDIEAHFSSDVSVRWDRDFLALDRLDPRQLLVNADLPYSLVTDGESDDVHLEAEPGFPCCKDKGRQFTVPWNVLTFDDEPLGVRLPRARRFGDGDATLRWATDRTPVAADPAALLGWGRVARMRVGGLTDVTLCTVQLGHPARVVELTLGWHSSPTAASLVVEARSGLVLRKQVTQSLASMPPAQPFRLEHEDGFDSVNVRLVGAVGPTERVLEIARVRYQALEEVLESFLRQQRCLASAKRALGGGRFAWLPHHDYEIAARCRITLDHAPSGSQDAELEQKVYFRTKGLPGLNAPARANAELEPYVEATYPRPGRLLYRREPVVIAMSERFNVLAPLDPIPSDAPAEKSQLLEWTLLVDRDSARAGEQRLSQVDADWIVEHRVEAVPMSAWTPALAESIVTRHVRTAKTIDPIRRRYEAMLSSPHSCEQDEPSLHPSQVLLHLPVEPADPEAGEPRWEPARGYCARLRVRGGPFVERIAFEPADATAFAFESEAGPAPAWTVAAGIFAPAPTPARQYAVFGETTWRHATLSTDVEAGPGQVGVALALSGTGPGLEMILVVIDEAESAAQLRILSRVDGLITELAATELNDRSRLPNTLMRAAVAVAAARG